MAHVFHHPLDLSRAMATVFFHRDKIFLPNDGLSPNTSGYPALPTKSGNDGFYVGLKVEEWLYWFDEIERCLDRIPPTTYIPPGTKMVAWLFPRHEKSGDTQDGFIGVYCKEAKLVKGKGKDKPRSKQELQKQFVQCLLDDKQRAPVFINGFQETLRVAEADSSPDAVRTMMNLAKDWGIPLTEAL